VAVWWWVLAQEAVAVVAGTVTSDVPAAVGIYDVDAFGLTCSGVVAAPDLVLTASFCVAESTPSGIKVWSDGSDGTPAVHAVSEILVNPAWTGSDVDGLVSAVRLVTPIAAFAPIPVGTVSSTDVGSEMQFVGWGVTGDASPDPGVPRSAMLTVTAIDTASVVTASTATGGLCGGDAGGPLLRDDGAGREVVAIGAYSTGFSCGVGDDVHARLDADAWVHDLLVVPDTGDTGDTAPIDTAPDTSTAPGERWVQGGRCTCDGSGGGGLVALGVGGVAGRRRRAGRQPQGSHGSS
jgi:hypothetical protein